MNLEKYLQLLPVVETASLPQGALFFVNGHIYEVTDAGEYGTHKARQWRKDESTEVALMPGSSFAQHHPLIAEGRRLPTYQSRNHLMQNGQRLIFGFVTEQNALDAAYLDVALCGLRSGVYVRRHQHKAAFEVTDGALIYRQYFFMKTNQGITTELPDIKHQLGQELISHLNGPPYWRLLPSWNELPYDTTQTVSMRRVDLDMFRETLEHKSNDDTLPHMPAVE